MGSPKVLAPCGTVAAYRRHIRRVEATCRPCRNAEAARVRGRRARKRAGAVIVQTHGGQQEQMTVSDWVDLVASEGSREDQ